MASDVTATPADGYNLALNYGTCSTPGLKFLTLEWHELNADGTPKNCTNAQTDTTTNLNARYNCGKLTIQPGQTTTLLKLKYGKSYR